MSPFVFSDGADRALVLVQPPLSISDLFTEYAAAGRARRAEIRLAAGPDLADQLDGFDYPAAA